MGMFVFETLFVPMKQILHDVFLTILMKLDPPTILSCIAHIVRRIFCLLQCLILMFDLPCPRYAVTQAQRGNFGDGSHMVCPTKWAKSIKMLKSFSPSTCQLVGLSTGTNKFTFHPLWPKI